MQAYGEKHANHSHYKGKSGRGKERTMQRSRPIFLGYEGDAPAIDDVIIDLSEDETVRQEIDWAWRHREEVEAIMRDWQTEYAWTMSRPWRSER